MMIIDFMLKREHTLSITTGWLVSTSSNSVDILFKKVYGREGEVSFKSRSASEGRGRRVSFEVARS